MTPMLQIDGLRAAYTTRKRFARQQVEVLHGVSLDVEVGSCVGLVGESGSGKTTLGRSILGLADVTGGEISFEGRSLLGLPRRQRRSVAKDIQVVFQDPYTSLNPAMTVSEILCEPLIAQGSSRGDAQRRVRSLLEQVGLPSDAAERNPRDFSGGQRQRVAIARALALDPKLVICDEPVSALDLTTQAQVLELLIDIQERTGVAYLFITHDLSVVRHMCHRVAVMYRGEIIEAGDVRQVTEDPRDEYTRMLLLSSPVADPDEQARRRAERRELLRQA
ncbi:MAG: dipeptide/oligopeptide/nickel ABC transporter ATP-binding protein [Leucobacter sp.]